MKPTIRKLKIMHLMRFHLSSTGSAFSVLPQITNSLQITTYYCYSQTQC